MSWYKRVKQLEGKLVIVHCGVDQLRGTVTEVTKNYLLLDGIVLVKLDSITAIQL